MPIRSPRIRPCSVKRCSTQVKIASWLRQRTLAHFADESWPTQRRAVHVRLRLPARVLLKRNDSVPVSMMCARSVSRSTSAWQSRGFGMTCPHSENGRLVVTMTAARSARSAITWNRSSAPSLGERHVAELVDADQLDPLPAAERAAQGVGGAASTSSLTRAVAVVKRTRRRCSQAATHSPEARWVLPVPASPISSTGSARAM